jgi:ATP-binding cassette subfamily B (MDR/TAP) protein 1
MDANDEEIIEAATTANVHSFISKLPNEYLTEVLFPFYYGNS